MTAGSCWGWRRKHPPKVRDLLCPLTCCPPAPPSRLKTSALCPVSPTALLPVKTRLPLQNVSWCSNEWLTVTSSMLHYNIGWPSAAGSPWTSLHVCLVSEQQNGTGTKNVWQVIQQFSPSKTTWTSRSSLWGLTPSCVCCFVSPPSGFSWPRQILSSLLHVWLVAVRKRQKRLLGKVMSPLRSLL